MTYITNSTALDAFGELLGEDLPKQFINQGAGCAAWEAEIDEKWRGCILGSEIATLRTLGINPEVRSHEWRERHTHSPAP